VNGKDLNSFEISVNGNKYSGPFETNSRVGANNYIELLDDLKKGDAVVTHKGGAVTFPRSNAVEIIPTYGKKGFACNLDDTPEQGVQKNKPNAQLPSTSSSNIDYRARSSCYGSLDVYAGKGNNLTPGNLKWMKNNPLPPSRVTDVLAKVKKCRSPDPRSPTLHEQCSKQLPPIDQDQAECRRPRFT
jgi:hypothetical protein